MAFNRITLTSETHEEDVREEDVREELARGGLRTAFSVETPAGWRSVDSPYEPRGEAHRMISKAVELGVPLVVFGAGSGFVAEEILNSEIPEALLVTKFAALAARNEKRLTAEGNDFSKNIMIVCGIAAVEVWEQQVLPFLEKHPDAVVVTHPREFRAAPALITSLQLRYARWKKQLGAQSNKENPERLLFFGKDGLLEREVLRQFQIRGIRVERRSPLTEEVFRDERALELLEETKPDMVFSMNNQGADTYGALPEACELAGIPWGTWFLDDPRFLIGAEQRMGAGKNRYAFNWDANGLDGCEEIGIDRAYGLPLATDPEIFQPGSGFEELKGRVVFVGTPRFASAVGYFHRLDNDEEARRIAWELAAEVLENRMPPSAVRIDEIIREFGLEGHFEAEALFRLPAFVTQVANQKYRREILLSLGEFRPIVFGNGWEKLLDDRFEIRPSVDYYSQLPAIYQSEAIHLSLTNLQMRSWPNQRLFDVPASGRVVFTDALEGLEGLFDDAVKPFVFGNAGELKERIAWHLEHPQESGEMVGKMRACVLEKHTVAKRVERIINVMTTK